MYRAHSKDINRNKSFHPLTYGNLRRVEVIKEGEEEKKQRAAERLKELQHDQEERRYDELVLANSADSLSGELARFRQTKNIFKAEYEADSARRQAAEKSEGAVSSSSSSSLSPSAQAPPPGSVAATSNAFLSKFKKEATQYAVKAEGSTSGAAESAAAPSSAGHGKRPRSEGSEEGSGTSKAHKAADNSSSGGGTSAPATGFVTSAEAAQLRKEVNLAQKLRHDPLMRVKQFQNSCVANAARQQELQQRDREEQSAAVQGSSADRVTKSNNDALQSRIRELLALKKKK